MKLQRIKFGTDNRTIFGKARDAIKVAFVVYMLATTFMSALYLTGNRLKVTIANTEVISPVVR